MGFSGRTFLRQLVTPDDETEPGMVENLLLHLYLSAKGPCVTSVYNLSLPQAWQGMSSLIDRNIPLLGVADRTQFAGPSCQKFAKKHVQAYPQFWADQMLAVGSTQFHQIEHRKVVCFNVPILGYEVPDGDFDDLDTALAAGYPLTWWGSYNFSVPASSQANDISIAPSKIMALDAARPILAQRAYILQAEQRWQPVPLTAGEHPFSVPPIVQHAA